MDGIERDAYSDILGDLLAPESDVLALPPLGREQLDGDVRQLIDEAFPDVKMQAHRDRLRQLLERRSYYSLAQLSQLYASLVVGNSALRTEAERDFEALVLQHLCRNSKQDALWDCFVRFLGACQRAHTGARSKPAAHLASIAQILSGNINRKMQATGDSVRVLSYQALHKAYFGDEREAAAILPHWFAMREPEKVSLRCAFPGCAHPHAFSVKMPSKVTFDRLFEHIHAVHIPKDVDSKESRKRSAPSAAPAAAGAPAPDATQPTLQSFLAKRKAPARAAEAPSDLEASSSSTTAAPPSSF